MSLNPQQLSNQLAQFYGSDRFYQYLFGFVLTEGAEFLAREAGAFWLIDIIVSTQDERNVKDEKFQAWKLTVANEKGQVVCEDGNKNILYVQRIDYTDFPLPEITLWCMNKTILLPSEYCIQALAAIEVERDDARRHAEDARGLLGRVLDEVEDLHPGLREAIERFLRS